MVKCKYSKKCSNYRENSFTCQHGGDIYCGIYGTLELQKITPFGEAVEFKRLNNGEQDLVKEALKPALIELIEAEED